MNSNNIINAIKSYYPEIYVDIISHNGEENEFQVRCFGVEKVEFRKVRRLVISLNSELFPDYNISLIPILFSKENTIEHFPEIALTLGINPECCGPIDSQWFLGGVGLSYSLPVYMTTLDCEPINEAHDIFKNSKLSGAFGKWDLEIASLEDENYSKAA